MPRVLSGRAGTFQFDLTAAKNRCILPAKLFFVDWRK